MTLREQAAKIARGIQAEELAEGFDAELYTWTGKTFTSEDDTTFFEFNVAGAWDGRAWVADKIVNGYLLSLDYTEAGI